mmetsp:Transcript_21773/g.19288  ORF Transcript_21773/g.19288 Transcript_21773/m.19288 type:complete len:123 (-) Transcript_21773:17-385(-)
MLMGNAPFSGKDDNETFQKIADYDFNKDKNYEMLSNKAKDLITKILVTESDKRMEYEDILAHEWFTDHSEKDEETKDNSSTQSLKENVPNNTPSNPSTKTAKKVAVLNLAPSDISKSHSLEL